jgi:hypothetical protein
MAGTFAPSPSVRGLLGGLDGIALIVATAMLTVHYFRRGNDVVATGFLVFVVGETLIVASAAMDLVMSGPEGHALTPLSQPLPFFAYPFPVATLFGWAWVHYRDAA